MGRKVYILDTTLRDGEQSPGASLSGEEKLEVALQLSRLNVDVIEASQARLLATSRPSNLSRAPSKAAR